MNNEVLVVFQRKKRFDNMIQSLFIEIFFLKNWPNFLILLMKNNNSIEMKPWFQFEVFFSEKTIDF